jgi:prepilin-type N-terminal cleavage/methylation domain-containing protein
MKRAKGFSLIEVMVALVILLFVVAATLGTLQDAMHASEAITKMAEVQDNLRSGMNLMARDLVQAGSGIPIGGILIPFTDPANNPTNAPIPLPINRPSPPGNAYTFPVQETLTTITPGPGMGPASLGRATDMITLMYADNTLNWPGMAPINNPANPKCNGVIALDGSTIAFDTATAGCATLQAGNVSVVPGDLLMLTSSQGGNILRVVTNVAGNLLSFAPGDAFNLNGAAAASGTIQQLQVGGTFPPIRATRVYMITYYIDTTNPVTPRLMRQVNFNPPQVVAQVIEDMQITFDLTSPVNLPGINIPVINPPDSPNQIRKVNLLMAARSQNPFSVSRQYFRTNLVTQVSMRSLTFQNRYN